MVLGIGDVDVVRWLEVVEDLWDDLVCQEDVSDCGLKVEVVTYFAAWFVNYFLLVFWENIGVC